MNNIFFFKIYSKQIILHGAGEEGRTFLSEWEFYQKYSKKLFNMSIPKIDSIVDNNNEIQGKKIHDILIRKPMLYYKENVFFIIGISRFEDIERELKSLGYKKDIDFLYWQDFLGQFRYFLIIQAKTIFNNFLKKYKLNISNLDITRAFYNDENLLKKSKVIYKKIENSKFSLKEQDLLLNVFLGNVLKRYFNSDKNLKSFDEIFKYFSKVSVISSLSMVYDKNIEEIEPLYKKIIGKKISRRVKTIGIYNPTYKNGGIERVISIYFKIFTTLGYNIVFFTDSMCDNEYFISKDITRIIIKHTLFFDFKFRLEELSKYIIKYHIDVMFYNKLKFDISSIYEPLYLKILGISTILEMHGSFLFFLSKNDYIRTIHHFMDKVIVLSRIDARYWNYLGANTKYIPNPIENGKKYWNLPITFNKRNGKNILWVGRTTDFGKHLTDTIEIMKKVIKTIPDAVLNILGTNTNLSKFSHKLKENHLEQNIKFLGYHTNVDKFYDETDVMLMTSEIEGFPMVLVESKLHGVPTVMYELSYLELVKDPRGIFEVPQRDTTLAATAIINILKDDDLRHKMSIEAKKSLYPFIYYDIEGEWKNVFDKI